MFPGQFPNYRGNLFNVVIVADLSQTSSLHFLATTASAIIARGFPFRWGIVPLAETEDGTPGVFGVRREFDLCPSF